jgi:hypothetical protein
MKFEWHAECFYAGRKAQLGDGGKILLGDKIGISAVVLRAYDV